MNKLTAGKGFVVCLIVGLAAAAGAVTEASESKVVDSSHTLPGGERVLEQSVVVPADLRQAWEVFATSEGFTTWAAPVAAVDLRLGGVIEASYSIGSRIGDPANVRNEIVAYVPQRMIAFRNVQAPPSAPFDAQTFQRLHTVVFFEEVESGETRVTIVQPGYGPGEMYDGVYRHFEWGNRWSLEMLLRRFESGPIDWAEFLRGRSVAAESH